MSPIDLPLEPPRAPALVEALRRSECYPHPADRIELIETHLSWVLLTGQYAYKIKKPIDLGFADFTTLERRRRFCEEEVRLNGRHAPSIYLGVAEIHDTPSGPALHDDGPVIEYAVRMRQFPSDALADRLLAGGSLTAEHMRALAARVAAFHGRAAVSSAYAPRGGPESVLGAALENIAQLLRLRVEGADLRGLQALWRWTEHGFPALREIAVWRHEQGYVRECHGDLHLGNIALIDGALTPFDGIEFNEDLRWIDVASDVAFTVMDLAAHDRDDLAGVFLDAYLEQTGDYGGLGMLRFYMVYRALVRAKVALLRQPADRAGFHHYLGIAQRCSRRGAAAIIVMHGLSGSGKTTAAGALATALGAIRVRSDVERKRLAGLAPLAGSGSGTGTGLYAGDATRATYARLRAAATSIVQGGYPAVVDAAFLRHWQRELLRRAADEAGVPFVIVSMSADTDTLRERIRSRRAGGADASEANAPVLQHQIEQQEPLSQDEQLSTLTLDSALPLEGPRWAACVRDLASRSGLAARAGLIARREMSSS